jgi:hypothetical protein
VKRALDMGLGLAALASLALNAFLLVRAPSAGAGAAPTRGVAQLALPAPCQPKHSLSAPAITSEPSAMPGDFVDEARDSPWATAQEATIEAHLADMASGPLDLAVECRERCCAITSKNQLPTDFVLDLQTSAGMMPWAERLSFSDRVVACFDRGASKRPPTELARRRKEVLASVGAELDSCARLTTVPVEVTILVGFDTRGRVVGTNRQGELAGSEAARCAERAIAEAASFEPQPFPGGIPFAVRLEPP